MFPAGRLFHAGGGSQSLAIDGCEMKLPNFLRWGASGTKPQEPLVNPGPVPPTIDPPPHDKPVNDTLKPQETDIEFESANSHSNRERKPLLEREELVNFLNNQHFAMGVHNGAAYRTREALEIGKRKIINEFQNILNELLQGSQIRRERIEMYLIQTRGVCQTTTDMLIFAIASVQKDLELIQEQISKSQDGQGWVGKVLDQYEIGFNKGVNEAIDFDNL